MTEFHADLAKGQPLPIEIAGKTYQLQPLRARDYAKIQARMRMAAATAIMENRRIDPLAKRHIISGHKPPTMNDILEEMSCPHTALWLITEQLKIHHPEVNEDWVEQNCNPLELVQMISEFSGLIEAPKEEENEADIEKKSQPQRLAKASSSSGQTTTSPTGGMSSGG